MSHADVLAEVNDLLSRYYTFVDQHDVDGWVALWAPDGVYDSGHVRAAGHAELRAFLAGHVVHTRHLVSNVSVDVEGERAVASNYMTVLPTAGKPDVVATAHCRSELRRIDGRWRLARHEYRPDPSFLPPGVGAAVAHEAGRVPADETARNKALVRLLTLSLWEHRDETAIDRYFAEEYVQHSADAQPGREGVRTFFRAVTTAIPDLRVTLDHLYAEGDRVFAFMSWSGTHVEPLFGAPPTGQPIHMRTAEIHRLEGGRIVEHWDVVDRGASRAG